MRRLHGHRGCQLQYCDSDHQSDRDAFDDPNGDQHDYAYRIAVSQPFCYTEQFADGDLYRDAHRDVQRHAFRDSDGFADGERYAFGHAQRHGDLDAYGDKVFDAQRHADG